MLSDRGVQVYLFVLGWAIAGCARMHYRRRPESFRADSRTNELDGREADKSASHIPPFLSATVLAITWFLIFRFILSNLNTSESYFDDAYKDVLRTPAHYATSAQLLTWAAVAVVWAAGDHKCDARYLIFGFLGAMGAAFSLWVPSAHDGVHGGGGGAMRRRRERARERKSVPIAYVVCSALAFLCVTRLRPCIPSIDVQCTGDQGFGTFLPNFRHWLQALHIVLILPLALSRLFPKQPSVDASVLYLSLAIASSAWHLAQGGIFALPRSDCQISIFTDLVACSFLTLYTVFRDSMLLSSSLSRSRSSRRYEGATAMALRNTSMAAMAMPVLSPAAVLAGHLFLCQVGAAHGELVWRAQRWMAKHMRERCPSEHEEEGAGRGWCNLGLWTDIIDEPCANGGGTAKANGVNGTSSGTDHDRASKGQKLYGYDEACERLATTLATAAHVNPTTSVLCCGCGSRSEPLLYRRKFGARHVTGIDTNVCEVEESRTVLRCEEDGGDFQVRRVRAGVEDLLLNGNGNTEDETLFPPFFFDRILALDNMYHYTDKHGFLEDCMAMLPPGGKIGVTDIILADEQGGKLSLTVHAILRLMGVRCSNVWTESEYRARLSEIGFSDAHFKRVGASVFAGWRDVLPAFLLRNLDYAVIVCSKPALDNDKPPRTKKKVAIVGSGLAGLSAARCITSSSHAANIEVTVLESNTKPGLAAHTKFIGSQLVDVPARMAAEGYYGAYIRLLDELRIPTTVVRTDCTYYGDDGKGGSLAIGYDRSSWANLWGAITVGGPGKLVGLLCAVSSISDDDAVASSLGDESLCEKEKHPRPTFGDWMQTHFGTNPRAVSICSGVMSNGNQTENEHGDCCEHYASDLPALTCRDEPFLYILIGSICWMLSCTYDHLINYPADVVLQYIRGLNLRQLGLFRKGQVVRVDPSIKSLERALLYGVKDLHCGTKVSGLDESRVIDGVQYDAIICATEARAVPRVVQDCAPTFGDVRYHPSTVYLHTDARMMPPNRRDWRCWNVEQRPGREGPQLTFWLNEFFSDADFGEAEVFQTWAPLTDIDPEKILQRSEFERVVHTGGTSDLVRRIQAEQGKRGIYYAGSYVVYGMGLLEQALTSGTDAGNKVLTDLFRDGLDRFA